jgi:hypothetical protein
MRKVVSGLLVAIVAAAAAPIARAHFRLIAPAGWIVEDMRGDPQKIAPCGGIAGNPGTPTNAITRIRGGQKLHISIEETIFHPGHYRIALARSRDLLPPDPEPVVQETPRGMRSSGAFIAKNPLPPLLADGLWAHTERPAAGTTLKWETDIDIPNITCEKCTLQIIQFMAEHPGVREGGFSYHHCADLQITADPAQKIDPRF